MAAKMLPERNMWLLAGQSELFSRRRVPVNSDLCRNGK
jgi:hypothetical protein